MTVPPHPTPGQLKRRRDAVLMYREEGYAYDEIAAALKIKKWTVEADITACISAKLTSPRPSISNGPRVARRGHVPPEVCWWEEPAVADIPVYKRSGPLTTIQVALDHLVSNSAVNVFANNLIEASNAGDDEWVTEARQAAESLADYLARMLNALEDPRAVAGDLDERDDLRR